MVSIQKIEGKFRGKDILSIDQFSLQGIKTIFRTADKMKKILATRRHSNLLRGKVMSLLFYEPSSRTFGSFISAIERLGGSVIPIHDMKNSSAGKGETLEDTARVFEAYSDIIVTRHPEVGSVKRMADVVEIPVINAGDGIGEHPTQALYDLYTIREELGRIDNIHVAFFGELAHYRVVNSLSKLLALLRTNKISFVSPKKVSLNPQVRTFLKNKSISFKECENINEVINDVDVLYVTRVKKEFLSNALYKKIQGKYVVDKKLLLRMKKKSIIMHALPRISEIAKDVDADPRAVYLKSQVRNGLYVRMALLALVLGKL
ncbi:MAG: aspartate carbamoyltransferase [Candidatus Levybacteria bacterium RIFCSPHIGHO2_01_FULL_40_15b]|nr:MAG: aspartate carbamoyltransferase [Candidatus Levybacteria bacterium RIFCSPHIGHO2_01_FULL_40_15b]